MPDDWSRALALYMYGLIGAGVLCGCCGGAAVAALVHTLAAWW